MFGHLAKHRMWDVLAGGEPSSAERAHLRRCASCASRLAEAREGLQAVSFPEPAEPSPLYWESMRAAIRDRIAAPRADERVGWHRPWVTSFASVAVAMAIVALVSPTRPGPTAEQARSDAWVALPTAEDDPALDVLRVAVDEGEGVSPEELGYGPALVAAFEDVDDENALVVARSIAGRVAEGGVL